MIQRHWDSDVSKRAAFMDKKMEKEETFVRHMDWDELFRKSLVKTALDSEDATYKRRQVGLVR